MSAVMRRDTGLLADAASDHRGLHAMHIAIATVFPWIKGVKLAAYDANGWLLLEDITQAVFARAPRQVTMLTRTLLFGTAVRS